MTRTFRPQGFALAALACGFAATLAAWALVAREAEKDASRAFEARAQVVASVIDRRMHRYIDLLYGLDALANHEAELSRLEFHAYVSALDLGRRQPGVQGLQLLRNVPGEERAAYVARVRGDRSLSADGYPAFDIHPPGERDAYWVVEYIEPLAGNEPAFGLDILMRKAGEAAARARDTGEPAMTDRYRLMQEKGSSYGLVIYLPFYAQPAPRTVEDRRAALRGFVNVVLRVDDVLAGMLVEPASQGLRLRLHDLGVSGEARRESGPTTLFYQTPGSDNEQSSFGWRPRQAIDLAVAGRQWRIDIVGEPQIHPLLLPLPLLVLGAGIVVSMLLYGILRAIARTRSEAVALAKQANRELRTQLSFTQQLIEAMPNPVFFKDAKGRYLGCNQAFERYVERPRAEIIGRTVLDILPGDLGERSASFDAKLLDSPGAQAYEARFATGAGGQPRDVIVNKATFFDPSGTVAGLVGVIVDITQRKQLEAATRESNEKLRAVVDALQESETQLRLAMDAAQLAMWHWEAGSNRFNCSERLPALFGRPELAPAGDSRTLQELLHAEDRDHFRATFRHAVKHGTDFQVDYRVVWPDGSVRWIANRGQVHRGPDGRATSVTGVAMDITDRKMAEQRIAHMAHHDALTGLPNRTLLRDRIQQAIAQAHRDASQMAVLFIDLDRFKTINDSLGHQLGDRLLQSVASRILVCVREGDTVARVGGDEFVIVIPRAREAADASAVAQKILEVLSHPFHLHGNDLHVGASIGISLHPSDGSDAETLMRNADTAMYHAKDTGRGNFQFFTQHMNDAAQQRLTLETRLRRALESGEFELEYQPFFDLRDRSVTGFEALLRWSPPGQAPVPPGQFIAAAEESGLIVPMGEWVLHEALRTARTWQGGARPLKVAVNVSARQLARRSYVEKLIRIIQESGIDPRLVELEVTESLIIEGAGEARAALDHIAALGVGLAIDDFGTGYSGLAYLKRLPIDTVKIDQSFVRDLTEDPDDAAIVTAIVAMARSLGMDVVAEGVETEEQLAELERLGCRRAQGFLLSRPMNAAAVRAMLARATATAD